MYSVYTSGSIFLLRPCCNDNLYFFTAAKLFAIINITAAILITSLDFFYEDSRGAAGIILPATFTAIATANILAMGLFGRGVIFIMLGFSFLGINLYITRKRKELKK